MRYFSEAEKVFHDEIREKKKAASGVHSKTGKNGYVGTMRFPSDIMSRKEKMKYRKASKVVTTNLYDEILPKEEFDKLETYEKKNRLQYWRNTYQNKEIMKAMGLSNALYYNLVGELELPKAARINHGKPKRKAAVKISEEPEVKEEKQALPVPIETAPVQEIIVDGLHLVFNGTYKAEQIIRQLAKFELLLDNEADPYYIELKLVQKKKTEKLENVKQ